MKAKKNKFANLCLFLPWLLWTCCIMCKFWWEIKFDEWELTVNQTFCPDIGVNAENHCLYVSRFFLHLSFSNDQLWHPVFIDGSPFFTCALLTLLGAHKLKFIHKMVFQSVLYQVYHIYMLIGFVSGQKFTILLLKVPYSSEKNTLIQEKFNKLIYSINTIKKCGIWQPVKFQ